MKWGGCKTSSPSQKDFATSWLKGAKPNVNVHISHEQFLFLNKVRGQILQEGNHTKVSYKTVIQILVDFYKKNNGEYS